MDSDGEGNRKEKWESERRPAKIWGLNGYEEPSSSLQFRICLVWDDDTTFK